MFPSIRLTATALAAACCLLVVPAPSHAADGPGDAALTEFRSQKKRRDAVVNRFFLKEERFEIAPSIGYVPNNPFARRYVLGAVVNYHFNEQFAAGAHLSYSPDFGEGDLKGLTSVLLDRAYNASTADSATFQQPLDKVGLSGLFGVSWAPLYGKINLVGETVLNFDLYGFAGLGMISKTNYIATYDENADPTTGDIVQLDPAPQRNEVNVGPVIGFGQNYFLNQMMAFKIDVRALFYVDQKPQYDPNTFVNEQRLYNNFIASAGMAFFFPRMKPRLYNF